MTSNQNAFSSLLVAAGLVLGLGTLGYLLAEAAIEVKSFERTVTVKGLSEREVPANVAAWPITFQVASNELDDVYASIEAKTAAVQRFLLGHGIPEDAISFSAPNVTDLHAQQWGDKAHIKYRYTGAATVTIYSENVQAVRDAMADMLALGKQGVAVANNNHPSQASNQFLFTNLNELKPDMIEEATKNARSVAEKFAKDSDSRLGKIKAARQGQFSISARDSTTPHIKKVRVVSTVEYYLVD